MTAEESRPRKGQLGRGLSALLGDAPPPPPPGPAAPPSRLKTIATAQVVPGRFQPRRAFPAEELAELAASIREHGVLQPILVRPHPAQPGAYELVAGERRWRAAQIAQLHDIPAIVEPLGDRAALEAALVENLQRQDLGPLEEADAYRRMMREFGYTQEQVAERVAKSRSHVANTVRLAELPERARRLLEEGRISPGHARVLLGVHDPVALAERIVREGLTVREAEAAARQAGARVRPPRRAAPAARDPNLVDLERRLESALGLKVSVDHRPDSRSGTITFRYTSLDQVDELVRRLDGPAAADTARAR